MGARPPKIGFYAKDVAKAKAWLEATRRQARRDSVLGDCFVLQRKDPDGNAYAITNRA